MRNILLSFAALILTPQLSAAEANPDWIKGYKFTLLDVQKKCIAKRNGMANTVSVECHGKNMKAMGRSCEGLIQGGLDSVHLNCSGGLWNLNSDCNIEMRTESRGEFNCGVRR